jgi:hypothetical protein
MADSRHFQLPRGDLTSGLSVFASGAERTLVADEHATEDRRRILVRLRVRAAETDESFGQYSAVVHGQSFDPSLKWHPGQPGPCRDHTSGEHDGARAGHPVRDQRPTLVRDPARPHLLSK